MLVKTDTFRQCIFCNVFLLSEDAAQHHLTNCKSSKPFSGSARSYYMIVDVKFRRAFVQISSDDFLSCSSTSSALLPPPPPKKPKYEDKPEYRLTTAHHSRKRRNLRRHTSGKQINLHCPICQVGLRDRQHLCRHFLIHLESNPFTCKYSGCGQTCQSRIHLKVHIRNSHSNGAPVCKRCGMRFPGSHQQLLKEHQCEFEACKKKNEGSTNPSTSDKLSYSLASNQLPLILKDPVYHRLIRDNPEYEGLFVENVNRRIDRFSNCEICGKILSERNKRDHIKFHARIVKRGKGKRFQCPICKAGFNHRCILRRHFVNHLENKPFRSEGNSKISPSLPQRRDEIIQLILSDPVYKNLTEEDPKVDKLFVGSSGNNDIIDESKLRYSCSNCSERFKQHYQLIRHRTATCIGKHFPKKATPSSEETEPWSSSRSNSTLCSKCGRVFENSQVIDSHMCDFHQDNPPRYRRILPKPPPTDFDPKIQKTFSNGENGDKPLNQCTSQENVCPICDYRFSTLRSLHCHFMGHLELNPFLCRFPNCGKKFQDPPNLGRHVRLVHSRKVDATKLCPNCGASIELGGQSVSDPHKCEFGKDKSKEQPLLQIILRDPVFQRLVQEKPEVERIFLGIDGTSTNTFSCSNCSASYKHVKNLMRHELKCTRKKMSERAPLVTNDNPSVKICASSEELRGSIKSPEFVDLDAEVKCEMIAEEEAIKVETERTDLEDTIIKTEDASVPLNGDLLIPSQIETNDKIAANNVIPENYLSSSTENRTNGSNFVYEGTTRSVDNKRVYLVQKIVDPKTRSIQITRKLLTTYPDVLITTNDINLDLSRDPVCPEEPPELEKDKVEEEEDAEMECENSEEEAVKIEEMDLAEKIIETSTTPVYVNPPDPLTPFHNHTSDKIVANAILQKVSSSDKQGTSGSYELKRVYFVQKEVDPQNSRIQITRQILNPGPVLSLGTDFAHQNELISPDKSRTGQPDISEPFKCPLCHADLISIRLLRRHFMIHMDSNPYICRFPDCAKKFHDPIHLQKHVGEVHSGVENICQKCGTTIFGDSDFSHLCNESGCKAEFLSFQPFKPTIQNIMKDPAYQRLVQERPEVAQLIVRPIPPSRKHHPKSAKKGSQPILREPRRVVQLKCGMCAEVFTTKLALTWHIEKVHRNKIPNKNGVSLDTGNSRDESAMRTEKIVKTEEMETFILGI